MLQIFSRSVRSTDRALDIGLIARDPETALQIRELVLTSDGIDLRIIPNERVAGFDASNFSAAVYALDGETETDLRAFERFMAKKPQQLPIIVLSPSVGEELVRWFLRLKVADWVKTPLRPGDFAAACGRITAQGSGSKQDLKCLTFIGARGGVGTTSIVVQAALLAARGKRMPHGGTCVVDLDLCSGACAEYLDLEPSWSLSEIIADPARLDIRMLEIMTASHKQGVSVLSARIEFGVPFHFAPEVVSRTLDLASQKYSTLMIDMPRHAESWSDGVILGSSNVYIVTDFSVPGVKTARRLVSDIANHFEGDVAPKVIVNKYSRALFGTGLSQGEVKDILGDDLVGFIAADDRLLREAIDRGVPPTDVKPRNGFTADVAKLLGY